MTRRSRLGASLVALALMVVAGAGSTGPLTAAAAIQTPEQFIGFAVGTDRKLARWDRIVEYLQHAAAGSERMRLRELGRTSSGEPFVALEISSPDAIKNLERYRQMSRRLFFQDGAPTARERDEIFRAGKAVVLVTCSVHGTEVGGTQMALELVHRLATDESPAIKKVLDNVVVLLVPSANPDGQIAVTDWYNRNVGTPFELSPPPHLDHPYAGHDSNRDMYMLNLKESQYLARLAWHEWFPTVWLDQHQMGSTGPRMFVMPAADPINPNVHPLIYRWNGILGQSQAAALEAAGKGGIIYNSTYTNFWQGALAWGGWWHNQIGLLTEVASVSIASPIDQLRAQAQPDPLSRFETAPRPQSPGRVTAAPLLPPTDVTPRTEYPRPWLGGRWTLRDIVDYQLISTLALLETVADRRETILRQIFEVNRQTVEEQAGETSAILVPTSRQHDPREAARLVERLSMAGIEVQRAQSAFEVEGRRYDAGTFVIPMAQVFARYAKDVLESQTYPEVRRGGPAAPVEPPYDVTAWSLGMLLGVDVDFVRAPIPEMRTTRVTGRPRTPGRLTGSGPRFTFRYVGAETAIAVNRLLKTGARLAFEQPSIVSVTGASRDTMEQIASDFGLEVSAGEIPSPQSGRPAPLAFRAPRVALYAPWTGGNIDEGWTRWVLEQHEFQTTTVHNADIRRGDLRQLYDVVILTDQSPRDIIDGYNAPSMRAEYRGGIGEGGVENLARFIADGGTLVTLGAASDLAIDRFTVPIRNVKRGLRREQHSAPGTILRLQVDNSQPFGYGSAAETYGFYTNGPFFAPLEAFPAQKTTVIARYPAVDVAASGWLRGEELMAGRAAVVSVDINPGRIVLFGLRPQHRGQTAATFPLLFNALYLAAAEGGPVGTAQQ
jgi:Zinc carboxypeptidase